jgi:DNA-binding CsgD family transcriptional regulator
MTASGSSMFLPTSAKTPFARKSAMTALVTSVPRSPVRESGSVAELPPVRLVVRHLCEATHCLLLLEGQSAVQPKVLEALRLTRREAEVLHWVAEGKTNEEIGMLLGLSPRTVGKHLEHIYDKLGVRTRTEAVRLVVERGLLRR